MSYLFDRFMKAAEREVEASTDIQYTLALNSLIAQTVMTFTKTEKLQNVVMQNVSEDDLKRAVSKLQMPTSLAKNPEAVDLYSRAQTRLLELIPAQG